MKSREPKAMEEIHAIREKMYAQTAGMDTHEKLMFIKEQAAAFKSKYELKTKRSSRKEKRVAARKG